MFRGNMSQQKHPNLQRDRRNNHRHNRPFQNNGPERMDGHEDHDGIPDGDPEDGELSTHGRLPISQNNSFSVDSVRRGRKITHATAKVGKVSARSNMVWMGIMLLTPSRQRAANRTDAHRSVVGGFRA